jgi:hypothetical protein
MGRLSERHDNNIRVHFQGAYLRVEGEWNRLRIVSKGRWQCNDVAPAGFYSLAERAVWWWWWFIF